MTMEIPSHIEACLSHTRRLYTRGLGDTSMLRQKTYQRVGAPRRDLAISPRTYSSWSVRLKGSVRHFCFTVSHAFKPGYESEIVLQVAHRTNLVNPRPSANIASVFAREGILGYVFLEGELPEVAKAVRGLFYVVNNLAPRRVPLEQRAALLAPRNPLSDPSEEGQWVRCLHGLYRNDIGFVCRHSTYRDAETSVALVPRIPEKTPDRQMEEGFLTRTANLVLSAPPGGLGGISRPKYFGG